MKTIGEYIKERRKDLNLTAQELAKLSGVSQGHITLIENGKRIPSFPIMIKLVNALDVNWESFLQDTGYMKANTEPARMRFSRPVPLLSWVKAGDWTEVTDIPELGGAEEWVDTSVKGPNVFALRVVRDSMEPEFKEGEIVIVNPNLEAKPNDYVIVKNCEEEASLKQLKRYGNRWIFHPLNPKYEDLELKRGEFRIVGKVAEKQKKYG